MSTFHDWVERMRSRENWVAAAVDRGLEAFARESRGTGPARPARTAEPEESPLHQQRDSGIEVAPSIP